MRYLCLVYMTEPLQDTPEAGVYDALREESCDYAETLRASGLCAAAAGLQPAALAASVRVRDGRLSLEEGPLAATAAALRGFYLIDTRDLNHAIRVASKIPAARFGCIEVRPIQETETPQRMGCLSVTGYRKEVETMTDGQATIDQAKADYLRTKELLAHALATTPDDRLNWAPSATARTPIQLVAHSASAVKAIHSMLAGNTVEFGNPVEADRGFREWERRFDTREQVLRLLEESSAAYIAWLDTLTPDHLQDTATLPFGLGTAPVAIGLTFAPNHLLVHKAQIDYIQTIYGDHDWHM